ncbi:hypothetical protein RKE29_10865 [Streptomyces sp. B1866]|uniref:hypothetical protein n=1 Tax=Streptomyces sp. B1866 TaxID=3075431 RepID=UPI002890B9B7|nr:hypothetical protein [Streptomyces sp. B1866]MDT3397141.1 hypothetical protein [Streptomyces sp. B1866]
MGLGGCIAMLAVGAILTLATPWNGDGFNVHIIGLILMCVGIIGMSAYISVLKRRPFGASTPVTPVVDEDHLHHRHHHSYYD